MKRGVLFVFAFLTCLFMGNFSGPSTAQATIAGKPAIDMRIQAGKGERAGVIEVGRRGGWRGRRGGWRGHRSFRRHFRGGHRSFRRHFSGRRSFRRKFRRNYRSHRSHRSHRRHYRRYWYDDGPFFSLYLGPDYYDYYDYYDRPYYGGRCAYWARRCAKNWGYGNNNYYGCLRYYNCR
jgi:hypothetical protein